MSRQVGGIDHQLVRSPALGHAARPRIDTFLQNWLTVESWKRFRRNTSTIGFWYSLQSYPPSLTTANLILHCLWRAALAAMLQTMARSGWPDDARFGDFWLRERFYKWFRQSRVLTLLQAIERTLQRKATKSERLLVDVEGLTIEHVMPQSWQQHWPIGERELPTERDARLQNIGNLTLVTKRLNPALSNEAWATGLNAKREQLAEHSKLELNKYLLASGWRRVERA